MPLRPFSYRVVRREPQIAAGTLSSIVSQAGLTVEQFQRLPD